ncbi:MULTISPECIES: hypothetical protein [Klebsiella]|jgi:hypothetical protein|uniref:Uncharacterized protein n=1 Tax=Klebsiella variicola (strain 342) TaxID=507522 RepID=B5RJZ8_KLEV3|nr:hypothetical protein [Klebsiella variicola]ACI12194.1 hypothetical protein KPK_A0074 [Klebsiella variicola]MCE7488934.1 hypothetical protein [Klebsiella variicola]
MQQKTAVRMEDSEIDALIVMVKDLIGDVGGFLGEEASREEEENALFPPKRRKSWRKILA